MYSRDQKILEKLISKEVNPEEVVTQTTTSIERDRLNLDNLFAYVARFEAKMLLKDYKGALDDARYVVEMHKRFPQRQAAPYLMLSRASIELKKYKKALATVDKASACPLTNIQQGEIYLLKAAIHRGLNKQKLALQNDYLAAQTFKSNKVYSLKALTKYFILANQDQVEARGVPDFSQEKVITHRLAKIEENLSNSAAVTVSRNAESVRLLPSDFFKPFSALKQSLAQAGVTHSTLATAKEAEGERASSDDLLRAIDNEEIRQFHLYRNGRY